MTKVYFRYNYERQPLELDLSESGMVTLNYTDTETNNELTLQYESMKEFAEFYATSCGVKPENLKNWVLLQDGLEYTYQLRSGTAGLDLDESELDALVESFQRTGMNPTEIGQALKSLLEKEDSKDSVDSHSDAVNEKIHDSLAEDMNFELKIQSESQLKQTYDKKDSPLHDMEAMLERQKAEATETQQRVTKIERLLLDAVDNDNELLSLLRAHTLLPEKDDIQGMLELESVYLNEDSISQTIKDLNRFLYDNAYLNDEVVEKELKEFIENYKTACFGGPEDGSDWCTEDDYKECPEEFSDEDIDALPNVKDSNDCYLYDRSAVNFYIALVKQSLELNLVTLFSKGQLEKQEILRHVSLKTLLHVLDLKYTCYHEFHKNDRDASAVKTAFVNESMAQFDTRNKLIQQQLLNDALNTGDPQAIMIEFKPVYSEDYPSMIKVLDIEVQGYQFYTKEMEKQFSKTASSVIYTRDGNVPSTDKNFVVAYYDVNKLK